MVCLEVITYQGSYRNEKVSQDTYLTKLDRGDMLLTEV
jgi:hypothetical protein